MESQACLPAWPRESVYCCSNYGMLVHIHLSLNTADALIHEMNCTTDGSSTNNTMLLLDGLTSTPAWSTHCVGACTAFGASQSDVGQMNPIP
jgi:hypothetical protein